MNFAETRGNWNKNGDEEPPPTWSVLLFVTVLMLIVATLHHCNQY